MPAMSLNHYTILARDLEATKDFYTDVVGLSVGDRPPLDFPGYWLYCGGVPTVHLIGHAAGERADPGRAERSGEDRAAGPHRLLLRGAEGHEGQPCEDHRIKFDERVLPRLNMTQLFYLRSGWHRGGVQLPGGGNAGTLIQAPPLTQRGGVRFLFRRDAAGRRR